MVSLSSALCCLMGNFVPFNKNRHLSVYMSLVIYYLANMLLFCNVTFTGDFVLQVHRTQNIDM